ncbi:MAG: PilN domain-containing protein [Gammaproteobacteria bacterium]
MNINLLPWREERKNQKKKEFFALMSGCAGLSALLVFSIHLFFKHQIEYQLEKNGYLKQEISQLDRQIAEIEGLQKEKERLLARMDIIQQLQSNRPHIVRLFDVVSRTVPDGLFLVSLTRADGRLLVEGKAESNTRVSKFMRNIESSNWLYSPVLSFIQADQLADKQQAPKEHDNMIGFNMQVFENKVETNKTP